MAAVDFSSVRCQCEERFTVGELENPVYLPRHKFDDFLSQDRVENTIRSSSRLASTHGDELRMLVEYAQDNPVVFLTLSVTGLIGNMRSLLLGGFKDHHVPIRYSNDGGANIWRVHSIYAQEHHQDTRDPWECFVEDDDNRAQWDLKHIDDFTLKQWMFLAFYFENEPFEDSIRRRLNREQPLPYVKIEAEATARGYFGLVCRLGLRSRVPRDNTPTREVAVKQLRVGGALDTELNRFFEREAQTLETMRGLHHAHLLEAISAYKRGTERCFVFPWASGGNLRQLWSHWDGQGPPDRRVRLWALEQIQRITDGLQELHETRTRHGDLKPENILIFSDNDNPSLSRLVIADVGISKFHAIETRLRTDPTTNRHGTLLYQPPEVDLNAPEHAGQIGRKYDSWSMGCVLLEFVIWLLRGSGGQNEFNLERTAASGQYRFWDQDSTGGLILHHVVDRWINQELSGDLAAAPDLRDLMSLVTRHLLVVHEAARSHIHEFNGPLQDIQFQ